MCIEYIDTDQYVPRLLKRIFIVWDLVNRPPSSTWQKYADAVAGFSAVRGFQAFWPFSAFRRPGSRKPEAGSGLWTCRERLSWGELGPRLQAKWWAPFGGHLVCPHPILSWYFLKPTHESFW